MQPTRIHSTRFILRIPNQSCRLLRAHHPYKRILHVDHSSFKPEDHHDELRIEVDGFLEAVALLQPAGQRHQHQLQRHEDINVVEPGPQPGFRRQRRIMDVFDFFIFLLLFLVTSRLFSQD
ncbi:hypothetical protein K435DRAFT_776783 [Dendrothele bispora CBS 962.96]|uniref:Uncharacterized protein n=1 Tax=Dendrothele bispora (strain CBS 962.96) TaxID=1314807 RepID=A0A4V4HGS6_DENBC|nr:hypothetical protein K435DRAFT_776783 [Dendrothele bispora CBS 962.96]